jgi:hypothetical protein
MKLQLVWSVCWTALTIVLCLISGCNVARVNDLRLASIEVVDRTRQVIPPELAEWHPEGRLVKLSFTTRTNVRNVVREFGLHVRADAYFCANQAHELAKLQILFDRDGAIAENSQPSSSADGTELWLYAAERSVARKDIETGKLSIPPYDLVQQPGNVCVQLHGRNMALEGFSSNVVTIAADGLTKALAQSR